MWCIILSVSGLLQFDILKISQNQLNTTVESFLFDLKDLNLQFKTFKTALFAVKVLTQTLLTCL